MTIKAVFLLNLVLAITFNTACAPAREAPTTTPAKSLTPLVLPESAELRHQIEQIVGMTKGKVGVAAVLLGPNPPTTLVELNADDHFPMQSVYKVPISMAVLDQIQNGKMKLDQKVQITKADFIGRAAHSPIRDRHPNGVELTIDELMRFAIGESDGTASDVLMKLAGGPKAIESYLRNLGVADMMVRNTENEFSHDHSLQYQNWTTPKAATALLRALHERRALGEFHTSLLLQYMRNSTPGAKRLKGELPKDAIVAHKTGTSGTDKGVTAATNDIGIITLPDGRSFAIAVFVSESPENLQVREGVISGAARAVWDYVKQNN